MSNYNSLKTTIDANIKQNGNQEITGQILNSVLNQMVNILGAGYQFEGIATIDTNPGTPDAKVFYIANGKGTYTNFGGIQVTENEVVVLCWDSVWHKVSTGIAREENLTNLEKEVATNFVGIDKERVIAEAIADLFAQVEGINDKLTNGIDRLSVKHLHIDRELSGLNIAGTFCLQGAGVPSASVVPVNWDFGRYGDWKGIPQFIGQEYFDTIDKVFYKAHGVTAVSDWKRITNA